MTLVRRDRAKRHRHGPRLIAWRQHTELVVVGIGHDDPIDISLADVDPPRPQRDESVDFCSLIAVGRRSDVEMESVLPGFGVQRGAAPRDHRSGEVRCADRGLFVLIPDQRPTERGAPEVSDLAGPVTGDRSETPAARQEVVGRPDDAELIALGVSEHDVFFLRALTDVDVSATQRDQSLDRFRLVVERGGRQVEVESVRVSPLRLRDTPEFDPEPRAIGRHETDDAVRFVTDIPAQRLGPKARQPERIVRIEAHGNELSRHLGNPTSTMRMTDTSEDQRSEPAPFDGHDFSGSAGQSETSAPTRYVSPGADSNSPTRNGSPDSPTQTMVAIAFPDSFDTPK
jgi:hypothetical protein